MPASSPKDLISIDEERGIITLKGHRVWLAKAFEFVSLHKVLESLMGKAAVAAIYGEGEQTSRSYMETIRAVMGDRLDEASPRKAFETHLDFFRLIGYGRFEVVQWRDKSVTVRLFDSIAAESYGPSKAPVCTVIAGVLSDLSRRLWKIEGDSPEFLFREVTCAASGSTYCEFVARE